MLISSKRGVSDVWREELGLNRDGKTDKYHNCRDDEIADRVGAADGWGGVCVWGGGYNAYCTLHLATNYS